MLPTRIRHLPHGRRILGWEEISAGQLAKTIGRTPGYICAVLAGRKRASIDTYRLMAKALMSSLDDLLEKIDAAAKLNKIPKYTEKYKRIVSDRTAKVLASEHRKKSQL